MSNNHTETPLLIASKGRVGIITLNRPRVMNALSEELMAELFYAIERMEDDPGISVIIIRGSESFFAAGADIRNLQQQTYLGAYVSDFITKTWEKMANCRIPTIAGVAGIAMGAGSELAMMCDMIVAADNARFSQPEVTLGLIPGAGATQRLPRFIGKAKAMDMCLTGRSIDAAEADRLGLVSRVVPLHQWEHELMLTAERVATMSRPTLMMIKESINRAFETTLNEGIRVERRLFHSIFALEDPHEGMSAFLEKRPPKFKQA